MPSAHRPCIRPDLLDPAAPEGVEVVQLTTGPLPASHVYMEAQIFAPDGHRFLLHESARAHGSDPCDPRHRYLVCDLEDGGALRPLTGETGATAPSVSPDGRRVYYFVDETAVNGGRLLLKRVGLDGSDRRTLLVLDAPPPGAPARPSRVYSLSTIRADGRRLALSAFFGDGRTDGAPWGLMVFDLETLAVEVVLAGPSWCNVHPQYSRSPDAERMRDILVQENHGNRCDAAGTIVELVGGAGADIHVIRDDGADLRDLPWGRDGNEFCQGHQCWRGRSDWAVTSTVVRQPDEQTLIESRAVPHAGHVGRAAPGGTRNDLGRSASRRCFYHFATDRDGRRLVTDALGAEPGGQVVTARFGEPGRDALAGWTPLARARSSCGKDAHLHPFLSPDGRCAFFNSDESGVLQAYMIRGLDGGGA